MNLDKKNIKIFAGNSNPFLAKKIADALNLSLAKAEIKTFCDGEISVSINESVRGCVCFIVQSTCDPVNKNLMELLLMIDAIKRACANKIVAVIPYFGYARQDRKVNPRDPISAKLVADLIATAGADLVLTMDLHSDQIQGFFNIPVDHLLGSNILADFFKDKIKNNCNEYIVVSPDIGSVTRARNFATKLSLPIAIIEKRRNIANFSQVMNIIGDVKNKKVILVDDLIDTAGTLCNAACALVEKGGANQVFACASHAVLSQNSSEGIKNSYIKKLFLLDTIPISTQKFTDKFEILSSHTLFANAISRIYLNHFGVN